MVENQFFARQFDAYIGKTLGSYSLERLSKNLETGPIFLSRHIQAGTRHRLRFLALPAALSPEQRLVFLGHFQREAGKIASLHHPALIPLNDYGIYEGVPYLVSPDLPAPPLQALLVEKGPVDLARVGRYLNGIAAALEHAHQQGILHLNLNTRNVYVRADGQPLVTEIGLLRMLSPRTEALAGGQTRLENGSPLLLDRQGNLLYALSFASAPAPELLLGQSSGASTDVYALGSLLYQLLTGHRALRGDTLQELAQQHLKAPPPSLNRWRQELPGELDQLISRAMNKDSAQRFRTPGALANAYAGIVSPGANVRRPFIIAAPLPAPALDAAQPTLPAAFRSTPGPARFTQDRQAPVSRRRAITLIAAGGGAAAAGVVVWLVQSHHSSGTSSVTGVGGGSVAPNSANNSGGPGAGHSGKVLADVSDVPPNSARSFPLPGNPNPGVLIHLAGGQFVAFNSTCTHAGCAVKYNPQDHLLECPCHGASFDPARNARVVGGPAPSPLSSIPITVNADGTITRNG